VLDSSLGNGFQKKDLVLLELGSHVNMIIAMVFLQRIISSFISSGNPVLLFPVNGVERSSISHFFEGLLPDSKRRLLKILFAGKSYKNSNNIMPISKKIGSYSKLLTALAKMKQRHRDKLLLNIMYGEFLQTLHGAEKLRSQMKNLLSDIMAQADLSVLVLTRSQVEILEDVSELSNIHLRFLIIDDTLFLQSLLPSSNLYYVLLDAQSQINLKTLV
ncbi:MAG: hypothetical protein M3286_00555, partial [Thermoproteota archaeon]|nr:hypothetical protein [Thermoproteota archaeon]